MSDPISAAIEKYLEGPIRVRQAIAGMSREQLIARPIVGKWSTLEVVAHLVDSEIAWCHRMRRVIAEDRPLLIGYDESKFTASLAYNDRDLDAELSLLDALRNQMAVILRALPESAWSREGVHNERGLIRLDEMVRVESEHILHHIQQIDGKRKALRSSETT